MSASQQIFAFDSDGLCASYTPGPAGCPFGPTGYEGPGTSFSGISPYLDYGSVNFSGGLSAGGTAYFSLESAPTSAAVPPIATAGGGAPGSVGQGASAAEPVNTATGDYYESHTDIGFPGAGPALAMTRTYSSVAAAAGERSALGPGWSFTFGASLAVNAQGDATVTNGNGSQTVFTPNGVYYGGFVTPARVYATLVQNNDGTYTYTVRQRTFYTFDSSGQLTEISDLNGNAIMLSYSCCGGIYATDGTGRSLIVEGAGGTNGRVASVIDYEGRTVSYSYDSAGNLTGVSDLRVAGRPSTGMTRTIFC